MSNNAFSIHHCVCFYIYLTNAIFQSNFLAVWIPLLSEYYITDLQHKHQIQQFNNKIFELAQHSEQAWSNLMEHYEQYVRGEIRKQELRTVLDAAHNAKAVFTEVTEQKVIYDKGYSVFRKLLSVSGKRIPLSEIIDCIDKVVVDGSRKIVVKWDTPQ